MFILRLPRSLVDGLRGHTVEYSVVITIWSPLLRAGASRLFSTLGCGQRCI